MAQNRVFKKKAKATEALTPDAPFRLENRLVNGQVMAVKVYCSPMFDPNQSQSTTGLNGAKAGLNGQTYGVHPR